MTWFDELQQASFRGVPFAVLGAEGRFGRRSIPHQYPMRDKPYIEDIGRSMRRISLTGFLVENSLVYGGGSVMGQQLRMIAAAEAPGPGTLIHPTLGELTVSVPEGGLAVAARWDMGRYFELNFSFIESGERIFPSVSTNTFSFIDQLAGALNVAAVADFLGKIEGYISVGNAVVASVVSAAAGFTQMVGRFSRDARAIVNLGGLLTGNFGRYGGGNVTTAFQQSTTPRNPNATMTTLLSANTSQRTASDAAAASMNQAAAALDATTAPAFASSVQAVTATIRTSAADPADALRLLGQLAAYQSDSFTSSSNVGVAQAGAEQSVDALCRRCAIADLVRAAASYAPTSYDDAAAVRVNVAAIVDAEILAAGDAGDDATYGALRTLRQALVNDLTTRGANLAPLASFAFRAALPSLVLAQRIYADPTREEGLVEQADPVHPAFMPQTFSALAS